MKANLLFERKFPTGTTRPLKIDLVSFGDATVEETVNYFKKLIAEYEGALVLARSERLDQAEQRIIELSKEAIGLREQITEKNTIIRYIENKLEFKDY